MAKRASGLVAKFGATGGETATAAEKQVAVKLRQALVAGGCELPAALEGAQLFLDEN